MKVDELWTEKQTADHLGIKPHTLRKWRCERKATQPRFVKVGRNVMYRPADVQAFIESQIQEVA